MITLATQPTDLVIAKDFIEQWSEAKDYRDTEGRNSTGRHDALMARALLRSVLFEVTEVYQWSLAIEGGGKPFITDKNGRKGPHISFAHTPGRVACAVSDAGPVGIDIETWRKRDFIGLARYAFGPEEYTTIAGHDTDRNDLSTGVDNQMVAFYRIWTIREALTKMLGQGIFTTFDGRDYVGVDKNHDFWTQGTDQLFYTDVRCRHSLAVATQGHSAWGKEALNWSTNSEAGQ